MQNAQFTLVCFWDWFTKIRNDFHLCSIDLLTFCPNYASLPVFSVFVLISISPPQSDLEV